MKARTTLAAVAALVALVVAGCGGASDSKDSSSAASSGGSGASKLSLVAYSTPQVVYDEVIPAFEKTDGGQGRRRSSSPSAPPASRAARSRRGLPADVVAFSLEPDVDRLVKADIVSSDWSQDADERPRHRRRVVVVHRRARATRRTSRPGTTSSSRASRSLTPNPFTSGAAKWNLLAAYGQADAARTRRLA